MQRDSGFRHLKPEGFLLLLAILLCLGPIPLAHAENPQSRGISLRLLGGVGGTQTDFPGMSRWNNHAAIQLVTTLPADPKHRGYGIEIGRHLFHVNTRDFEYLSMGILLDQQFLPGILGQIGTVGYFRQDDNANRNPFGLRSSIGIEHVFSEKVTGLLLMRDDIIFDEKIVFAGGIEIGIGFMF